MFKYNSYSVKGIHIKCTTWWIFKKYIYLCLHHMDQHMEYYQTTEGFLPPPNQYPSEVSSWLVFSFISFWNSYKWNHTICIFLCLASFTLHSVCKIHHGFKCGLFYFHEGIVVHCTNILQLTHSIVERHLGCYQCVAAINSTAMNILMCFNTHICISVLCINIYLY